MLACNDRLVHYRTPTEGGSSGSPVFDEEGWTVVALHHAGRRDMPRLDGKGTYEANEGIQIHAIQQATRST
jgi:V8-like Glu-specific endopeptidase